MSGEVRVFAPAQKVLWRTGAVTSVVVEGPQSTHRRFTARPSGQRGPVQHLASGDSRPRKEPLNTAPQSRRVLGSNIASVDAESTTSYGRARSSSGLI